MTDDIASATTPSVSDQTPISVDVRLQNKEGTDEHHTQVSSVTHPSKDLTPAEIVLQVYGDPKFEPYDAQKKRAIIM